MSDTRTPLTEDELARPLTAEEEATVRESLTGSNVLPAPFSTRTISLPRVHYDRGLVRRLIATLDALRATPVAVPIVRRYDLTKDSDPAHDFDGPDPFASPVADTAGIDAARRGAALKRLDSGDVPGIMPQDLGGAQYAALWLATEFAAALRTPKPEGE